MNPSEDLGNVPQEHDEQSDIASADHISDDVSPVVENPVENQNVEYEADAIEENKTEATPSVTQSIVSVPIEISVEIGTFDITLNEKSRGKHGDIFPLHSVAPSQVRLMYRDMEVGRGSLIDVNGQIAVQVEENWCTL